MAKQKRSQKKEKCTQQTAETSLKEKVEHAFSSSNTSIYKRHEEIEKITTFLESNDKILNIVGVPGTGKTSTVLYLSKNYKRQKYLNFYKEPDIKKIILKNKYDLVIIDEFDKYYQSKASECKFIIHHITSQGGKLITLGNNLEFGTNSLFFKPYTSLEIQEIVRMKIEKEVGKPILSNIDLKILCRKHAGGGDMRNIFKFILHNFDAETGMVIVNRHIVSTPVEEEEEISIHHRIIMKLGEDVGSKVKAFRLYFKECEDYGVPPLSRMMFYELFDTISYK